MKKVFLILFILLDLAVIGAAAMFLTAHLKGAPTPSAMKGMFPVPAASAPGLIPAMANVSASSSTTPAPAQTVVAAGGTSAVAGSRKIGFTYRNSRARKVMIRADFTGWRAEPMEREATTGTWKYVAALEPGEYAYCYSVDDKSIRDPANKHTKTVGKTVVSSIIVQPLTAAPH